MPPRRYTVREKRDFIRKFEEIQHLTTQRDYCVLNNLKESTFSKWMSVKHKLERTAGHKKNAQRQPNYTNDSRALMQFLDEQQRKQEQVSLLQLLAHAKTQGLLIDMTSYMSQYLFCWGMLYIHAQRYAVVPESSIFDHPDQAIQCPKSTQDYLGHYSMITQNVYRDEPPLQNWNFGHCSCRVSCGADCMNKATATECDLSNCGIPGQCGNKWVLNTIDEYLEVFETENTGYGLRSLINIPANTVILDSSTVASTCSRQRTLYNAKQSIHHPQPRTLCGVMMDMASTPAGMAAYNVITTHLQALHANFSNLNGARPNSVVHTALGQPLTSTPWLSLV